MKVDLHKERKMGMTLVEILLVIAICATLAFFLLPRLANGGPRPKIPIAKTEIQNLVAALDIYQKMYSDFRMFKRGALTNSFSNFTFGTFNTSASAIGITNASGYQANNSEIMSALLDLTQFGNGKPTPNTNHCLNPQKTVFLTAKMSPDTKSHGVGPDGVYRDPWGNPYIITIVMNGDGKCRDAFYKLASVSEKDSSQTGLNQIVRPTPPPYTNAELRNSFEAPVRVMVWSFGPDGKADLSQKANEGVNKDNILSW